MGGAWAWGACGALEESWLGPRGDMGVRKGGRDQDRDQVGVG